MGRDYDISIMYWAGVVTTLAGSDFYSWMDGIGTAAAFASPLSVSVDSNGAVYVADNNLIRKVLSSGVCRHPALLVAVVYAAYPS